MAKCVTTGATCYVPVVASRSLVERAMQRTRAEHLHDAQHEVTSERSTGKARFGIDAIGHVQPERRTRDRSNPGSLMGTVEMP